MPIRHCIVHLIDKKPDGTPAVLHARDSELAESSAIEYLLADLNESYNAKQGKAWGFFHAESGAHPFSGWLKDYLDEGRDFTQFSRTAVEHLQKLMEESNLSTGGHVLFAHYQQGMTDYLAIALLHHSEGVAVTSELDVTPSAAPGPGATAPGGAHQPVGVAEQQTVQAVHLVHQGQERQEGFGVLPRLHRLPGRCRWPGGNADTAQGVQRLRRERGPARRVGA